jgi:hypothetical protein
MNSNLWVRLAWILRVVQNISEESFGTKKEGGERGARGASLGSFYNGRRREIGRSMPTFGIRCTESVWEIKAIKWGFNSLNSTVV